MNVSKFFDHIVNDTLDIITSSKFIYNFSKFNRAQLKLFAQQFHSFVDYFPKYLGALIWRCPDERLRLTIIDNLVDESGGIEKIAQLDTSDTHPQVFRRFAYKLNLHDKELFDLKEIRPYTEEMLTTLQSLSIKNNFYRALGGISPGIENVFYKWIKIIHEGLLKHSFFEDYDLAYFKSHSVLDIEHGEKFKKVILPILNNNAQLEELRQGSLDMGNLIYKFFDGLSNDIEALEGPNLLQMSITPV